MSLCTDQFFYDALRNDADITELTEGRIFNPARTDEDEQEDRLPYIIISFEGMKNQKNTKDESVEGQWDDDVINILCVAEDREALADLVSAVRPTIKDAVNEQTADSEEEYGFTIDDYTLSAGPVQYDPSRPCCFQTLTYECETYNT